jgi:medium-chain acyl-[acyl-carrier-protein] hydrolase
MGSLIAYRLAAALLEAGRSGPEHLIVGALPAPHLPLTAYDDLARLLENDGPLSEAQAAAVREAGMLPDALLRNQDAFDLLRPTLRADHRVVSTYPANATGGTGNGPIACPITAICGADDTRVDPAKMVEWHRHTCERFNLEVLAGGHLLLHDHRDLVFGVIARVLKAC